MTDTRIDKILARTVDVPDFPKPGIVFKDLSPVFSDAETFGLVVDLFEEALSGDAIEAIVGIEARGFVLGAALATRMGKGFVPIRKPGKLPRATHRESYALEYGQDALEIHRDAFSDVSRAVLVDDVLATGGTAAAAAKLVERAGGNLVRQLFLLELGFLGGASRLAAAPHTSLVTLG